MAFDDISARVRRTWAICERRLEIDATAANRAFIRSIPRLWWALRTGAMAYGILVYGKPDGRSAS